MKLCEKKNDELNNMKYYLDYGLMSYTVQQIMDNCMTNDRIKIIINNKFYISDNRKGCINSAMFLKYIIYALPNYATSFEIEKLPLGDKRIKIYVNSRKLEEKILNAENEWYNKNNTTIKGGI